MKIKLVKDRWIKGKPRDLGETVLVNKDLGERLISEGLANRIVSETLTENRIVAAAEDRSRRFCNHKRF